MYQVECNEMPPNVEHLKGGTVVSVKHPQQPEQKEDSEKIVLVYQKFFNQLLQNPVEKVAEMQREVRDNLIKEYEWRIQRYQQQKEVGVTDDTEQWWQCALSYIQQLRDITKQDTFPHEVEWPQCPI